MSREWRLFWADIIVCCRKVQRFTHGMDLEAFKADERTYDATVRNLEVIGEAVKQLPDEARALSPAIEWRKIAGLRDFLAHVYLGSMTRFSGTSFSTRCQSCSMRWKRPT